MAGFSIRAIASILGRAPSTVSREIKRNGGREGYRAAQAETRTHTPGAWRVPPIGRSGYGYLWFTAQVNGRPVAWGWGYGAQFALVAPSLRLAVATAAIAPRAEDLQSQTGAIMALVAQVVAMAT